MALSNEFDSRKWIHNVTVHFTTASLWWACYTTIHEIAF